MKVYSNPDEPCQLDTAQGRKFLIKDMFSGLEYLDEYGLLRKTCKNSRCYEISVTVKRVKSQPKKKKEHHVGR